MRSSFGPNESIKPSPTTRRCLGIGGGLPWRHPEAVSNFCGPTISQMIPRGNLYRHQKCSLNGGSLDVNIWRSLEEFGSTPTHSFGVEPASRSSLLACGFENSFGQVIGYLGLVACHFRKGILESLVFAV